MKTTQQKKKKKRGKEGKITALNFPWPPPPLLRARTQTHPTYTSAHTATSNTHAPMPMWLEQETWTCRGFFPSSFQSDGSRGFIPVHRRPFADTRLQLWRVRTSTKWLGNATLVFRVVSFGWVAVAKAHDYHGCWTCWPVERLWFVISTGCVKEALRACHWAVGGAASFKGAELLNALRSFHDIHNHSHIHWCSLRHFEWQNAYISFLNIFFHLFSLFQFM